MAPPAHPSPSDTLPALGCYTGSVAEALDIEALSLRYGAMVLRRCRRLLRDEDEALDACQDVFVRLLVNRRRLEGAFPSSLLFRIATNVCLNRIRDRVRRPESPDEEALAAIWLFGRQPESSRTIAVLHYVDGLTLEEVARQTNLSVSGVRKRLRKLRHMLTEVRL